MTQQHYQVGDVIDIKENDPHYDTKQAAANAAHLLSEQHTEQVFGVWQWDEVETDCDLIILFHCGEQFNK